MTLDELERLHIDRTLRFHGGNRTRAARKLGMSRRTLHRKLHTYQLEDLFRKPAGEDDDEDQRNGDGAQERALRACLRLDAPAQLRPAPRPLASVRKVLSDLPPVTPEEHAKLKEEVEEKDKTIEELKAAIVEGRGMSRTSVTVIEVDPEVRVPGYESWWDVPVAEVSQIEAVQQARKEYVEKLIKERYYY